MLGGLFRSVGRGSIPLPICEKTGRQAEEVRGYLACLCDISAHAVATHIQICGDNP